MFDSYARQRIQSIILVFQNHDYEIEIVNLTVKLVIFVQIGYI